MYIPQLSDQLPRRGNAISKWLGRTDFQLSWFRKLVIVERCLSGAFIAFI